MSLINQMLQDLETRRASGAERGALPNQVRVLPREEARSMPWWLMGIAAAVAVIAAFAWQFNSRLPAAPSIPVAQTPGSQLVTASTPGVPATRFALELENVPAVAAPAPAARKAAAPSLAASTVVAAAPRGAAKSAAVPPPEDLSRSANVAPAAPTAVANFKPATATPRTVEVAQDGKAQPAPENPQIDKRSQALSSQQLAENDYREAATLLGQGRLAEAQEVFRRALQHNPAHVGARQGLFGLLVDARKNAEAEQILLEGLKLNPNQPGFAMALASLQYERGDVGGAIETMQKTAPAAQASPDYLARLAGLLQRQARHKEAVDNYQAALRLAPGSGVWLMGMGISLQALSRNGEAQDAFRRAKSSNTLNADLQAFVDQRLKQLQ
jgi:MSHA biogenesis protein MshN